MGAGVGVWAIVDTSQSTRGNKGRGNIFLCKSCVDKWSLTAATRHFVSAILTSRFRGEVFHRVGGGSVLLFTRSSNLKTWVRGQVEYGVGGL